MPEGNRLSDMQFDEVSLVTRGANQDAKVVLFKADTTSDDEDLSKSCETDHRGLKKRERCPDCGMVSTGKQGKMRKASPIDKALELLKSEGVAEDVLDGLEEAIQEPAAPGATLDAEDGTTTKENKMPQKTGENTPTLPDAPDLSKIDGLSDEAKSALNKFFEDVTGAFDEVVKDNAELAEELEAALDDDDDSNDDDDDEVDLGKLSDEDIEKLDPAIRGIAKAAKAATERAEAAESAILKDAERRLNEEMAGLAKSLSAGFSVDNDEFAKALGAVKTKCGDDIFKTITEAFKSANEVAKSGAGVGGEHGSTNGAQDVTKAETQVEIKVAELRKNDSSLTEHDALMKVLDAHPELYSEHVAAMRARTAGQPPASA